MPRHDHRVTLETLLSSELPALVAALLDLLNMRLAQADLPVLTCEELQEHTVRRLRTPSRTEEQSCPT